MRVAIYDHTWIVSQTFGHSVKSSCLECSCSIIEGGIVIRQSVLDRALTHKSRAPLLICFLLHELPYRLQCSNEQR